jgi:hypothetical protein
MKNKITPRIELFIERWAIYLPNGNSFKSFCDELASRKDANFIAVFIEDPDHERGGFFAVTGDTADPAFEGAHVGAEAGMAIVVKEKYISPRMTGKNFEAWNNIEIAFNGGRVIAQYIGQSIAHR